MNEIKKIMKQELIDNNPVLKLSFDFALAIIEYCEGLEADRKYVVARQLLKSGTSIGANAREAQNAESKADFIHKFKIAAKEIDETQYWLQLCQRSENYPNPEKLLAQLDEVDKIVTRIIATSKRKMPLSYFFSFFVF